MSDQDLRAAERAASKGDPKGITSYVRALERKGLAHHDVDRHLSEFVLDGAIEASTWMPGLVLSFVTGVVDSRGVLIGEADNVNELQFDHLGATFGIKPSERSVDVFDGDGERDVRYPSDVSPTLLLALLRSRHRLDADLSNLGSDSGSLSGEPAGDLFDWEGTRERFFEECRSLDLEIEGSNCRAGPLLLNVHFRTGPSRLEVRGLDLTPTRDVGHPADFVGSSLPDLVYTPLDLKILVERIARLAGQRHECEATLSAFLLGTCGLDDGRWGVRFDYENGAWGARVSSSPQTSRTCLQGPFREIPIDLLRDVAAVNQQELNWPLWSLVDSDEDADASTT